MELELGNQNTGQFFSPPSISEMMAQINYGDELRVMKKPFVTLSEPACGAGGMVLAFVKAMLSYDHNPAEKLWVQCIDVDRVAAMMCYIQLSLWNVPAQVIVGNTLSLEFREKYFTPAHYLFSWDEKLRLQRMIDLTLEIMEPVPSKDVGIDTVEDEPQAPERKLSTESRQLDLF